MAVDFLDRILEQKRAEVEAARREIPEECLAVAVRPGRENRSLLERLSKPAEEGRANIIAEIKRASPSKGRFRMDLDAAAQARCYESGGAAAISVLTDRLFFEARPGDLESVHGAVELPVLRKDFVISTYQVYEAAAMGADAVPAHRARPPAGTPGNLPRPVY